MVKHRRQRAGAAGVRRTPIRRTRWMIFLPLAFVVRLSEYGLTCRVSIGGLPRLGCLGFTAYPATIFSPRRRQNAGFILRRGGPADARKRGTGKAVFQAQNTAYGFLPAVFVVKLFLPHMRSFAGLQKACLQPFSRRAAGKTQASFCVGALRRTPANAARIKPFFSIKP